MKLILKNGKNWIGKQSTKIDKLVFLFKGTMVNKLKLGFKPYFSKLKSNAFI